MNASLNEFVGHLEGILDSGGDFTEAETGAAIVNPLLETLGWDVYPPYVRQQYPVDLANSSGHADYALCIDGVPMAFIELKRIGSPLDKAANQLESYMRQEDVNIGLATNGETYKLYLRAINDGSTPVQLVDEYSWDELDEDSCAITALSRESVEHERSKGILEEVAERRQALRQIRNNSDEIVHELVSTLDTEVGVSLPDEYRAEMEESLRRLEDRLQGNNSTHSSGNIPSKSPNFDIEYSDEGLLVHDDSEQGPLFPVKTLGDIHGDEEAMVGVYPTNSFGIRFVLEHQAWGFISIAQTPEYFTLYLTKPQQSIHVIGVVDEIVDSTDFISNNGIGREQYDFDEEEKVVKFSAVYQLADPLPIGPEEPYKGRGLSYTTLGELRASETMDDL